MVNSRALKSAMVAAGYNQSQMAKELGISLNSLCSKINNRSKFSIDEAIKICDILKINNNEDKVLIFLSTTSQNRDKCVM